jgi:hypothetical protein
MWMQHTGENSMTDEPDFPLDSQPASPEMAEKLAINRTGRLTPAQRRTVMIAGMGALVMLLCPLTLLIQLAVITLSGNLPVLTVAGLIFTGLGLLFIALFGGMIFANVQMFLPDAFGRHPVKVARGPLQLRATEGDRPELPFSYIVQDYSFAPYVAPPDVLMRPGAPYLVYYAAHSRLLLSLAALDAPDADQWKPTEEGQ